MLIVDAQVHLWGGGTPLTHHRQISSYSADDLLKEMDEGGVDAAIIHPPSWDPNSGALAIEAACQHPGRLSILGKVPPNDPGSASLLPRWRQQPGMLGLRLTFLQPGQATWPTDGTMDWFWPAAEKAGLPVALMASTFLPTVGQVAERHPGLKLIVDHMGRPSGLQDAATWDSLPELLALAKYPNVAVKATGAPSYSSDPYPTPTSTITSTRFSTPSGPTGRSGAPTLRACLAPGASVYPSSPKSCRGCRKAIGN